MPPIILASDKISTLFGSFKRLLHYISKVGTCMVDLFCAVGTMSCLSVSLASSSCITYDLGMTLGNDSVLLGEHFPV